MHGRRNGLISQLFTFCDPQIVVLDIFCPLPIRLQSPRDTGQLGCYLSSTKQENKAYTSVTVLELCIWAEVNCPSSCQSW